MVLLQRHQIKCSCDCPGNSRGSSLAASELGQDRDLLSCPTPRSSQKGPAAASSKTRSSQAFSAGSVGSSPGVGTVQALTQLELSLSRSQEVCVQVPDPSPTAERP